MTPWDFGKRLLDAHDLDPVYDLCWVNQIRDFTWYITYWGFYHVGLATTLSEYPNEQAFWEAYGHCCRSSLYPRGRERRHYRANNAIQSWTYLSTTGIDALNYGLKTSADPIRYVEKNWVGFGPWIAFKIADMLERLEFRSVDFSDIDFTMYKSPKKAAQRMGMGPKEACEEILFHLDNQYKAPPRFERPLGIQEAETILCKWKSFMDGHYHIGEDVQGVQDALRMWPDNLKCQTYLAKYRETLP